MLWGILVKFIAVMITMAQTLTWRSVAMQNLGSINFDMTVTYLEIEINKIKQCL